MAGGPSAAQFDFSRLNGKQVVLVNEAYRLATVRLLRAATTALFSVDPDWVQGHRALFDALPGEHHIAVPLDGWPQVAGIENVKYIDRSDEAGLSEDPGRLCTGGNSGYAAINLAYLKRAREIHLVGFDMDPRTHEKFRYWLPKFHDMLPQLAAAGCTVLNHNPNSSITAFERMTQ